MDDFLSGRCDTAKVSAEIRAHEDRHGLNRKALLALRWRLPEGETAAERKEWEADVIARARAALAEDDLAAKRKRFRVTDQRFENP
jgi:hypothetical protein